jgi:excisionase family DNA binding protein
MSGPDRSLSAHEAAARCGVSERSVRRWIASGRLKADASGREFRISERDLEPSSGHHDGHIGDSPDVSPTPQQ